jgi:hypothetical protein
VQRSDFYVGLFLVATIALVVAALVATSGIGIDRNDIYVQTDDATSITVDTKVFLQGAEVGRVAEVTPRPAGERIDFIIRLSILAQFPNGEPVRFPRNTIALVDKPIVGSPTLMLAFGSARDTGAAAARGFLTSADTIRLERRAAAMEAVGELASDLKGEILKTLNNTNLLIASATRLADSVAYAAGAGRRFLVGVQPGAEKALGNVASGLERLRVLFDSTNVRSGVTLAQVNAVLQQSRTVMVSADSLTRLLTAMGGESRPEVALIIANMRNISEQMQYVLEQLGRRPTRAITGVRIPDSLTVEGRARRDSVRSADSLRARTQRASADSAAADTTRQPRP